MSRKREEMGCREGRRDGGRGNQDGEHPLRRKELEGRQTGKRKHSKMVKRPQMYIFFFLSFFCFNSCVLYKALRTSGLLLLEEVTTGAGALVPREKGIVFKTTSIDGDEKMNHFAFLLLQK